MDTSFLFKTCKNKQQKQKTKKKPVVHKEVEKNEHILLYPLSHIPQKNSYLYNNVPI